MKKIITAVAVLALGATLAIAAPKGNEGYGHREGGHEWGAKFAEKLNLTDAQKQQVQDIKKNFHEQNKAFFDSFRANKTAYKAAKDAGDTAKADAIKATLDGQKPQMKSLRDAERQQIRGILNPAQQAQFDAMKAKHEAREKNRQ